MTRPFTDVAGELAFAQLWQVTLVIAAAAILHAIGLRGGPIWRTSSGLWS